MQVLSTFVCQITEFSALAVQDSSWFSVNSCSKYTIKVRNSLLSMLSSDSVRLRANFMSFALVFLFFFLFLDY